jgi:dTDP-4-amino-4,6-dideoxygalactose transaminase
MPDRPAILGGVSVRAGKSWPTWPQWGVGERRGLEAVLESGVWSSAQGDEVNRFVAEFTEFQGARHGIAVTNGTHALETALAGCGIGEGDEVIVPALTFVATATAVLVVNATPVLVDVDPASFCIDPSAVKDAITDRTRAVIAVHLAGTACDMDALLALCADRGIALVEDCAHSQGTRWRGRGTGAIGKVGGFSFQQSKLMTAGEGGIVTTNDAAVLDRVWSYANFGRTRKGRRHGHAVYGTNMRMTEWQGAMLRAQLRRLPEQHRVREERGSLLDATLAELPGLRPQRGDPHMDSRARYAYGFRYDPAAFSGLSTAGFKVALEREGIPLAFHYPSLNQLELFREDSFAPPGAGTWRRYPAGSLPHAEDAAASTVWLDHRVLLCEPEDTLDVVLAISRIRKHARAVGLRTAKPVQATKQLAGSALRRLKPR